MRKGIISFLFIYLFFRHFCSGYSRRIGMELLSVSGDRSFTWLWSPFFKNDKRRRIKEL